jgi:hypothetical protein
VFVSRRCLSTDLNASPCAKPWPMPDVKLSPKNLSEADKKFVLDEVAKFGGLLPIERASMPPSSWYMTVTALFFFLLSICSHFL